MLRLENEGGDIACRLTTDVEALPVRLEIDNVGLQVERIGMLNARKTVIVLEESHG